MGLFQSETVTAVGTTVSRAIPDKLIPNSVKTGLLKGILEGDQLVEHILEDTFSSIGIKAERMYAYGKSGYIYGLPTKSVHRSTDVNGVALAIITAIEGKPVTLDYSIYGHMNRSHYGWQTLVDTYGYSTLTNELSVLSAIKGHTVYLDNLEVVITQAVMDQIASGALDQWGDSATSGYTPERIAQLQSPSGLYRKGIITRSAPKFMVDTSASADYFRLSIIWSDGVSNHKELLTFPMVVPDETDVFVQVKYTYLVTPGIPGFLGIGLGTPDITRSNYFTYRVNDGAHPELDALYSASHDGLGSFFPFGYFRFNKHSAATDKTSEEYLSSKKLMKYLGMDFAKMSESINTNPDIADVESALLMMAVPAETSNPMEQCYLYDFFKGVYLQTGAVNTASGLPLVDSIMGTLYSAPSQKITLIIQDARFKTTLGMSGISRSIKSGSIGKVGSYSSHKAMVEELVHGKTFELSNDPEDVTWISSIPNYFYRKQITASLYEEIQVSDLRMTYYIWGKYTATNTMVLLDHSITEKYSSHDRELLYARALHYVFNAKVDTKVAWYKQDWFMDVILIVALAWAMFSLDPSSFSLLGFALAGGYYAAAALLILEYIVTALVVSYAFKLFVKAVGPKFAIILAIIAAAYSYGSTYEIGGLTGSPWANQLLQASTSLIKATGEYYTKAIEGIKHEADEFGIYAKGKENLLEEANKLLEHQNILSPFTVFGESPDDYYNRTVHSGNIGTVCFDAMSNYVDIALTLPKLATTVGDTFK